MNKICSRCCKEKPATHEYFYRMSSSADGLGVWCRDCVKAYQEARKGGKGMKMPRGRKPASTEPAESTEDGADEPKRRGRTAVEEVLLYENDTWKVTKEPKNIILYNKKTKEDGYYGSFSGVFLHMVRNGTNPTDVSNYKSVIEAVEKQKEFIMVVAKEIDKKISTI